MARGPDGDLIADGIGADQIRDERRRHESGWVHVLTPATTLDLCADDPRDLCHQLAPAYAKLFVHTLVEGGATTSTTLSSAGRPVLLTAEIDASRGGIFRLGRRIAEDGDPSAELTIDAETGDVRVDYTRGSILSLGRSSVIEARIPELLKIELVRDDAAISGSVNGRPLAKFRRAPRLAQGTSADAGR